MKVNLEKRISFPFSFVFAVIQNSKLFPASVPTCCTVLQEDITVTDCNEVRRSANICMASCSLVRHQLLF